jgi:hypothetical protein
MSDTASFSHSDMIRKVEALLNTAQSFAEAGNDEAAQSYVEKAHALQQKYSIDQAMIEARTGSKTEKILSKEIIMAGKWGKRKVTLAHVIAHATHCTGYFRRKYAMKMGPGLVEVTDYDAPKQYVYVVFGFESDVDYVEFLINSLNHQLDTALDLASKNKNSWDHGRSFNASFCAGFTNVINRRLRDAAAASQKQAQSEQANNIDPDTCVSLVLADKKQRVSDEMKAQVGRLRKGSSYTTTSGSGYSAGVAAGSGATLARGSVNNGTRGSLNR